MSRTRSIPARVGQVSIAVAVAAAGSITLFQGVSSAAAATYTASPATGPATNATYVITLAGAGFADAAGTSLVKATTGVKFGASCGADDSTGTSATAFNVVSATRLAVTTPSLTITTGSSAAFKVCVYSKTSPFALLGSATYTIYNAPSLAGAITPAAGPAFGGNTITVVGANFTSKAKVTLGGVALSSIKVTGTTSLTATVPAHAASATALQVVVTTEGGPNPVPGTLGTPGTATDDDYTYKNAVSVSPSYGVGGAVLSIRGVGFTSLDFTGAAKVFLVPGIYNQAQVGTSGVKTVPEAGTCTAVQVISDTELVCVAPTMTAPKSIAYTVTVVSDGAMDATGITQSVVSSGATFTYSSF